MTRYVGVDYGTRRIGLAISDGLGLTARPLDVVGRKELLTTLSRVVSEYGVDTVVVGLPTGLGGDEGFSARGARELGAVIADRVGVTVVYVDERFTSRMAESALLESGMRRRGRKETVDKVAAAIILQTYLDSLLVPGNSDGVPGVEESESDDA